MPGQSQAAQAKAQDEGWAASGARHLCAPARRRSGRAGAVRADRPSPLEGGGVGLEGFGSDTASDAEANRRETGKGYTHTKANLAYIQV